MVTTNGTENRASEVKSNATIPTGPYFSGSADTVIGYIYFFICIVGYVPVFSESLYLLVRFYSLGTMYISKFRFWDLSKCEAKSILES